MDRVFAAEINATALFPVHGNEQAVSGTVCAAAGDLLH